MLRNLLLASVVAIGASNAVAKSKSTTAKTPIEHIVVLMLENRSFDHYLGFLKKLNKEIDGCLPDQAGCSNSADPSDPNAPVYTVTTNAVNNNNNNHDPGHGISDVTVQIFSKGEDNPADMQGFVYEYNIHGAGPDAAPTIMDCFPPEHVPVLANLSMEYAMFDGYFSSVPGPTMPNRAYAAAASSHGMGDNNVETILKGLPNKTMFRQLTEMGLSWRVYFDQVPAVLMFKDMRHADARPNYRWLKDFASDCAAGDLPQFSWLEPVFYSTPLKQASDQHPDHDVALGEQLIKETYEALRASPLWEKSALVITYDEHGGFFDHVVPPNPIPSPDGIAVDDDFYPGISGFNFTRGGVRVPFVVVSPWVRRGQVVHAQPSGEGQFEHSSIAHTAVHRLFYPADHHAQADYLNARDAWAAPFDFLFLNLTTPRTDCPLTTPSPHFDSAHHLHSDRRLNDLQRELVGVAAGASEDSDIDLSDIDDWTEAMGAEYVTHRMQLFLAKTD